MEVNVNFALANSKAERETKKPKKHDTIESSQKKEKLNSWEFLDNLESFTGISEIF